MAKDLSKIAKQKKIKYFLISYVDFFGVLRSKLVPSQAIKEMQKEGAGFAGFSTYLDMSPADADMASIPDPESFEDIFHYNFDAVPTIPFYNLVQKLENGESLSFTDIFDSPEIAYNVDFSLRLLKCVTLEPGKISSYLNLSLMPNNSRRSLAHSGSSVLEAMPIGMLLSSMTWNISIASG